MLVDRVDQDKISWTINQDFSLFHIVFNIFSDNSSYFSFLQNLFSAKAFYFDQSKSLLGEKVLIL